MLQVYELLEAVEQHIGCTFYEERPQETLEALRSDVRVLQAFSVKKPLVNLCFTFQPISQSWSSLIAVQLSDITPIIDRIFVGKPTASPVIKRRYFVILGDVGDSSNKIRYLGGGNHHLLRHAQKAQQRG